MKNSSGLYYLGSYLGNSKLNHYNFALDSSWISHEVNARANNFIPHDATYSSATQTFFIVGNNINENNEQHVRIVSLQDTILDIFHDGPNSGFIDYGRGITLNSDDNIVVLGVRAYPNDRASFIMILDQELKVLHTTQGTDEEMDFPALSGFMVDSEDNIVVPGAGVIDGSFHQLVAKLDPQGKLIWKKKLDYNHNNRDLTGQWRSIVETHEKDGYIIAGSESYQSTQADTFIVKAALAKLSSDGNEEWYRTYRYRSGLRASDGFYDIEPTSDGGYVAVGGSPVFGYPTEEELPWVQSIIMKVDAEGRLDKTSAAQIVLDKQASMTVYPNPSSDILYLTQDSNQELQITIYDNAGKVMDRFSSEHSDNTTILSVANYPSGMYKIVSRSREGTVAMQSFVKQ